MCSVRFLVLDLARLRLASWLASLATCMPGWACTKERELKLSCQQYLWDSTYMAWPCQAWLGLAKPGQSDRGDHGRSVGGPLTIRKHT